ncbi:MAG: hypothetical protein VKK04_08220 [Synechococcales bacterium]|nr:hypothetical protein [Synechococcales bacterium]
MNHDVRQWLGEIRALQGQIAQLRQELSEAYASAANWRSLYETEARQRRQEAQSASQTIQQLKAERQALADTVEHQIEPHPMEHLSDGELKAKLAAALLNCDRLTRALKAEQDRHAQTRQALTSALGDTVEQLAQGRAYFTGASAVPLAAAKAEPS